MSPKLKIIILIALGYYWGVICAQFQTRWVIVPSMLIWILIALAAPRLLSWVQK